MFLITPSSPSPSVILIDIAVMNTHMFCMTLEASIVISHLSNF